MTGGAHDIALFYAKFVIIFLSVNCLTPFFMPFDKGLYRGREIVAGHCGGEKFGAEVFTGHGCDIIGCEAAENVDLSGEVTWSDAAYEHACEIVGDRIRRFK